MKCDVVSWLPDAVLMPDTMFVVYIDVNGSSWKVSKPDLSRNGSHFNHGAPVSISHSLKYM